MIWDIGLKLGGITFQDFNYQLEFGRSDEECLKQIIIYKSDVERRETLGCLDW